MEYIEQTFLLIKRWKSNKKTLRMHKRIQIMHYSKKNSAYSSLSPFVIYIAPYVASKSETPCHLVNQISLASH